MATAMPVPLATRRRFLLEIAATGLVLGFANSGLAVADMESGPRNPFDALIAIGEDNRVTIFSAHLEMGQGIHHGIATLVQEELSADDADITVEHGWGNPDAFADIGLGGPFQSTGGASGSIYSSWNRYRIAGAAARMMLAAAAAAAWGVAAGEIDATKGRLRHASGREATYGTFARAAAAMAPPHDIPLKDRAQWRLIGNPQVREADWGGPSPNYGAYTGDVVLPGLLTAVVLRPPRFGARLADFDSTQARGMNGFVAAVRIGDKIAVIAKGMWAALRARDHVVARWNDDDADRMSSVDQVRQYIDAAQAESGRVATETGDVAIAFAGAARTLEATYTFPYLAHAPLEPLNATVRLNPDGTLEVWTASQAPDFDVAAAARAAGIASKQVILHVKTAGGSFGRRLALDSETVVEAVEIARAIGFAAPVKLQWTREDDMRCGRYRPAFVHHLRAGLDAKGNLVALTSAMVGQSIVHGTPLARVAREGVDPMSVETVANMIYRVPNRRVTLASTRAKIPVTWWRSVGATHGVFAVECFIDEIADAAHADPVLYRLGLLDGQPRVQAVLQLAADEAGWGTPLPPSQARGVAISRYFETCVAHVAEVSVDANKKGIIVHRVVCALDCGIAVNPDKIASQIEGAIGFGLGPVFGSQITFADGLVQQSNFDDYPVLRIDRMPDVEVHVLPSDAPPRGVGEPGLPPIAPAVANAVFAATRRRQRSMPLSA